MAKKSDMVKFMHKQKFAVRHVNRCPLCGRSHGYMRRFNMCRICFRENALKGFIPGIRKISW
ncbi:MAG: type Z 30S ribosomal protein S14 [Patescibacteria group bacterium]|nr:type Z 30S ribosomal protein S14 [Patescibacteria group bacterium]